MTDWNFDNDRRGLFRIQEPAMVDYQIAASHLDPIENQFPKTEAFKLLEDLHILDEETENHLRRISEEDKALSAYLRLLNRKVDRIAQSLLQPDQNQNPVDITLSETGISFITEKSVQNSTTLAIRLQLLPEGCGLLCYAKAIYSEPQSKGYRIGCEFLGLSDRNRQTIAKHLMESDARERRIQRQQKTTL